MVVCSSNLRSMAQISVGKLLPNLKVTLGNEVVENEYSEDMDNEFSDKEDLNAPDVEIVRSWMESLQAPKIYKNKSGGFTTGLDLISEENAEALGKRAERFGLEKEDSSLTPNISSLYESIGVSIENRSSAKMKNIRLDALHMRGVNELNTNEIFHYFKDYGPASVEWINDFSCNVVWLDETSCARALLGVSKLHKNSTAEEEETNDTDEAVEDRESPIVDLSENKEQVSMDVDSDSLVKSCSSEPVDIPIPPGHWRLGVPHPKAKTILLRFATKDDKKLPGAEKRSNYYKKYGNPNYGGLKGLISSSRKRKIQAAVNRRAVDVESSTSRTVRQSTSPDPLHSDVPKVPRPKPPRMRMYADDEELKTRKIWSDDNVIEKQQSVHSRLGSKYTKDDLCYLGAYHPRTERDDSDDCDVDSSRNARWSSRKKSSQSYDVSVLRNTRWKDRKRNWASREDYDVDTSRDTSKWKDRQRSSEKQVDLRTKLKRLRSSDSSQCSRIDSIKKENRNDSVSKHRSPLCVDSEEDSDD